MSRLPASGIAADEPLRCDGCVHENPAGARFCQQCGAALNARCARYETALLAAARFCHPCDLPVGESVPMELAEQLDPEAGTVARNSVAVAR